MSHPVSDRVLLGLFRRFPPRSTIFMAAEGRAEQEYADEVRFPFWRFFGRGPELFAGARVLDLGCGYGGRPVRYLETGAKHVIGVEIGEDIVARCREFATARGVSDRLDFRVGTGEAIPAQPGEVDLVVMNDVMEHVVSPARTLAGCERVLAPGGRLAVVFPPYYDVTSGSHLHGYATRLPGLNALFSTERLKSAARRRLEEQGHPWREYLREVPTDKLWNQNGLTVRGFERLVAESGLEVEQQWRLGHLDHRVSDHRGRAQAIRRPAYAASELLARLPGVRELACTRVCALLRKPAS